MAGCNDPRTLGGAVALGATVVLLSTTPSEQPAALIGRLALRAR